MLDSSVVILFWSITRWVHPEPNARPTGHGLRVHQRSKSFLESRKSSPTPQQVGPVCIRSQGKTGAHGRTNWQAARRGSSNLNQGGGAVFFADWRRGGQNTPGREKPFEVDFTSVLYVWVSKERVAWISRSFSFKLASFCSAKLWPWSMPLVIFFANQECERTLSGWVEEWILESVKEA